MKGGIHFVTLTYNIPKGNEVDTPYDDFIEMIPV